eukprot:3197602-Rhodomonas_salina.3
MLLGCRCMQLVSSEPEQGRIDPDAPRLTCQARVTLQPLRQQSGTNVAQDGVGQVKVCEQAVLIEQKAFDNPDADGRQRSKMDPDALETAAFGDGVHQRFASGFSRVRRRNVERTEQEVVSERVHQRVCFTLELLVFAVPRFYHRKVPQHDVGGSK